MKELFRLVQHYKTYVAKKNRQHLDYLLSRASDVRNYDEMLDWLEELIRWLREESTLPQSQNQIDPSDLSALRIRYLLHVLNRNENWRKEVQRILSFVLSQSISVEFFSEVGLSFQNHFLPELAKRITEKLLPEGSASGDFIATLRKIFSSEEDLHWINLIDDTSLLEISNYFSKMDSNFYETVKTHLENAIYLLSSKIHAEGLSSSIRRRLNLSQFRVNPFFLLSENTRFLIQPSDESLRNSNHENFIQNIQSCKEAIKSISISLDKEGVSIDVVYSLDLLNKRLDRLKLLAELYNRKQPEPLLYKNLLMNMIEDSHGAKSILSFFSTNLNLLLKKIVQRNSEIGTHYMASTPSRYLSIFKKALGGGILTGGTVIIKFLISKLTISGFLMGLLSSINYSVSFLAIQFLHFTLATKQPASTAPALARELNRGLEKGELDRFLIKTASVLRAQFASVFGNILAVIPMAYGLSLFYLYLFGHPLLPEQKAIATIQSLDILGPSAFYAAFTGFLLFCSSIMAGWIDNWFVLNKVSYRVSTNKYVVSALGASSAQDFGKAIRLNAAGLAGNISLGLILGLLPELFKFLGIPLDVRHVTLSMGSVFAAVPTMGLERLLDAEFIRAILGVLVIGLFNVYFSFMFALGMAVKAEHLSPSKRRYIVQSVFYLLFKKPWMILFPVKSSAREDHE